MDWKRNQVTVTWPRNDSGQLIFIIVPKLAARRYTTWLNSIRVTLLMKSAMLAILGYISSCFYYNSFEIKSNLKETFISGIKSLVNQVIETEHEIQTSQTIRKKPAGVQRKCRSQTISHINKHDERIKRHQKYIRKEEISNANNRSAELCVPAISLQADTKSLFVRSFVRLFVRSGTPTFNKNLCLLILQTDLSKSR